MKSSSPNFAMIKTYPKELYYRLTSMIKDIHSIDEKNSLANIILEHQLGLDISSYILNDELTITDADDKKITEIIHRINQHEPIQYILSKAYFHGRSFYVNHDVLIPRPETEELVDIILKDNPRLPRGLAQNPGSVTPQLKILEIGTGSGCIAITLSKELNCSVVATDISINALAVAQKNVQTFDADVHLVQHDIVKNEPSDHDFFNQRPLFDIIVSNPPYVLDSEMTQMRRNVLEYEPHSALFVKNSNPLVFYDAISKFGRDHLKENGRIFFEINEKFGEAVAALLSQHVFSETLVHKDIHSKDRFVSGIYKK